MAEKITGDIEPDPALVLEVVSRRYLDEYPHDKIADELGISVDLSRSISADMLAGLKEAALPRSKTSIYLEAGARMIAQTFPGAKKPWWTLPRDQRPENLKFSSP